MADISLNRTHNFPIDAGSAKLQKLVEKFKGDYGAMIETVNWNADKTQATAEGKMFSAKFGVTASNVNAEIDLKGFAAKMAKGMVQGKLEKAIAEEFPA